MASIGSRQKPAIVRVQTAERAHVLLELCRDHGVQAIIGVEPDEPEDISDLRRALEPAAQIRALPKIGRNEPCPCGSATKFKKCCGGISAQA